MLLELRKFGKILNGRPAGREAVLRVKQIVNGADGANEIVLDVSGVELLTPSFADELINGIKRDLPNSTVRVVGLENNVVIKDTLKSLNLI